MKLRDTAQFFTALPDGAVENEEADGPEFLVWPGRPVAEALCSVLQEVGCEVRPIYSADFKGWEFKFRYRGRSLWCRVSVIERHIAYFDDPDLWPKIIGRKDRRYVELLTRLADALARDERFHDVRWYALNEIETDFEGALRPVA
jgi:hypothetical protein